MEAHDGSSPVISEPVRGLGTLWHFFFIFCPLSFFLSFFLLNLLTPDSTHLSDSLSPSPPSLSLSTPSWHLHGWRPSAVRTGTQPRTSWSPSSRLCSGFWLCPARLSASSLPFYRFCPNAKASEDWGSSPWPGLRPQYGFSSSSVCVTSWDVQVNRPGPITRTNYANT